MCVESKMLRMNTPEYHLVVNQLLFHKEYYNINLINSMVCPLHQFLEMSFSTFLTSLKLECIIQLESQTQ